MSVLRFLLASAGATVVAGVVLGFGFGLMTGSAAVFGPVQPSAWDPFVAPFILGVVSFLFFWPIALAHMLLVALPLYAGLVRYWPLRWWNAALAGLLIGATPSTLYIWLWAAGQNPLAVFGWRIPLFLGISGAFAGLTFWAILRGGRTVA